MAGKAVAVDGCTILINGGVITSPSPLQFLTQASTEVFIKSKGSNKGVFFGDIKVVVPSGASGPAGALAKPVTCTIKATGSNMKTSAGIALLLGDKSSGEDTGTFVQGQTSTDVPLLLTVADAGQSDVTLG